jgi:hypothetical protein
MKDILKGFLIAPAIIVVMAALIIFSDDKPRRPGVPRG